MHQRRQIPLAVLLLPELQVYTVYPQCYGLCREEQW
jgi:hypothetical protein